MPNAFLCFLIALVPPLWYRAVLWPRLRHWDPHHAMPAAREANRKAGWPDWLAESGVSVDFWGADDRLAAAARGEGLRVTIVGAP